MTKKHSYYWMMYKPYLWLLGIRVGKKVIEPDTGIEGTIVYLSAESINDDVWECSIDIKFDRPLQGNEEGLYDFGAYDKKSFDSKILLK